MARWIGVKPLKVSRINKTSKRHDYFEVSMHELVPTELVTANWIGSNYGNIDQLSSDEMGLYAQWKRENPLQSKRWEYLERSRNVPQRLSLADDAAELAGSA